jgi:hypothetical protein
VSPTPPSDCQAQGFGLELKTNKQKIKYASSKVN